MSNRLDLMDIVAELKAKGQPFAVATVVRTVSLTAAKAGAKATILPDGTVSEGWIGGGCARMAVAKAAREAIADGQPRLISIQPQDLLDDLGVAAGETRDGIEFARNKCPSQGTMDVFIEPVLPRTELLVLGASPIALAVADLGGRLGFTVAARAAVEDLARYDGTDVAAEAGFDLTGLPPRERFIIVATQGRGDDAALREALSHPARLVQFVGSRAKAAALKEQLRRHGLSADRLAALRSPAGLDIGAVTPQEIALSILAEITQFRRLNQRGALTG
jgi:xanthine dehydrogenase accessory factor